MPKGQFASRDTKRLELREGQWVEVKKYLSHGERYHLYSAAYRPTPDGSGGSVDLESAAIEYLATWLVDWSFHDDDGKSVAVSRDAIRALEPDWADEVQAAIAGHVTEIERGKAPTDGKAKQRPRSSS